MKKILITVLQFFLSFNYLQEFTRMKSPEVNSFCDETF